jgi:peroxiredoxin
VIPSRFGIWTWQPPRRTSAAAVAPGGNRLVPALVGLLTLGLASSLAALEPTAAAFRSLQLADYHGQTVRFEDYDDAPYLVIAFLGTECPLARLYAPRLSELSRQYEGRGVAFVGSASNVQDHLSKVAVYAQQHGINFPIVLDSQQQLADLLAARRTPEVVVLDADRKIRYRGRIDDQYAVGVQRSTAQSEYLAAALDALLAGQEVPLTETEPVGCLIGRRRTVQPQGSITYSRHVADILNRRCVECHREGEIAPFSLTSYRDTIGWESTMAEVILDERMPPWSANPAHGAFRNDARLTDDEKATLLAWIENGCPEGDPADLPAPPQFVTGWGMGEPDLIIPMRDEPFEVPATGTVAYQHFEVDPGFAEDRYVIAGEARPGNRSVVHHIIAYIRPPGHDDQKKLGEMLLGYAPGSPPVQLLDGDAIRIPKGSKILFELHYTPNGRPQSDLSSIGLRFADQKHVQRLIRPGAVLNTEFEIPAEAGNHEVVAEQVLDRDIHLLNMSPHMHLRGKSFRYEAFFPDGRHQILLDVPRYDFNWQLRYELLEPLLLPKGTRIRCTAHFDNSSDNPHNPDATQPVRWGAQSWEEMMIGFYNYR